MYAIVESIAKALFAHLASLGWSCAANGLSVLDKDNRVVVKAGNEAIYTGISDTNTSEFYIRHLNQQLTGTQTQGNIGACLEVVNASIELRAVAFAPVDSETYNGKTADQIWYALSSFKPSTVQIPDVSRIRLVFRNSSFDFEDIFSTETGQDTFSGALALGAVDFALDFTYLLCGNYQLKPC